MQILPISSPTPAQGAASPLAGLFGQTPPTGTTPAGGLFAALMAMLAPAATVAPLNQQQMATLTGQPSPVPTVTDQTIALAEFPLQIPAATAPTAATSPLASVASTPDMSAQDILDALRQLIASQPTSPELKSVMAGDTLTVEELETRLAALDEDTRTELLGELSQMLQPLLIAVPVALPAAQIADTPRQITDAQPVTAAGAQRSATPQPEAPQQNSHDTQPPPAQGTPTAKSDTSIQTNDAPDALTAALADLAPVEKPKQSAAPLPPSAKPHNSEAAPVTSAVAPGSTAAPVDVTSKKPTKNAEGTASVQATPDRAIVDPNAARIAAAGTEHVNDTSTLGETPVSSESGKLRFADHLDAIKLNRTGAHMPVSDQIAVHLSKAAQRGQDQMTIRLQPPELGRIDIKLDVAADGMVKATFQIDQPATLDLMLRDHKGLERALSDAGLKTDGSSLNFNLRGDNLPQRQPGGDTSGGQQQAGAGTGDFATTGEDDSSLLAGVMEMTWYVGPDRVDVRI